MFKKEEICEEIWQLKEPIFLQLIFLLLDAMCNFHPEMPINFSHILNHRKMLQVLNLRQVQSFYSQNEIVFYQLFFSKLPIFYYKELVAQLKGKRLNL